MCNFRIKSPLMDDAYIPLLIGVISSGFGYLVSHDQVSFAGVVKSICVSVFVSWAVFLYAENSGVAVEQVMLFVAGACLVSEYAIKYAVILIKKYIAKGEV